MSGVGARRHLEKNEHLQATPMSVVVIDDESALLSQRVGLLEALVGWRQHPPAAVHDATVRVQAAARGRLLRRDRDACERAMRTMLAIARGFLARSRLQRLRRGAVLVQARARGRLTRASPVCRVLRRYLRERENSTQLELLTLRLLARAARHQAEHARRTWRRLAGRLCHASDCDGRRSRQTGGRRL